jgi:hypothetical protein
MANYMKIDVDWLEQEIGKATVLREHAQSSGKPVAMAAASVRLESLREIRRNLSPLDAGGASCCGS